ncbi:helix-turn-helix domain-containing protein [Tessaracoccus caeni]|uniref:helix-turn-helix domain-containing protein n=1 Tax=Tessaracoccus caeni TaxID=3031239 RepID=UPI0023D9EF8F|nr:helix-turn-helix domain-containing protein [Tessaracoccus caeni]MDF1490207.1 helix-turn-helix domain-containing protein [Tessaracoccus caeni]
MVRSLGEPIVRSAWEGWAVMRESGGRRWAAMTAVAGTVFIAAGAFWLSFTSLADLAARSGIGTGQAWAWPLIVDGIIVVATVAVVALAGQRSAWYPWALLVGGALVSVTANAIHAVVAADADVPRMLAASVAAVPPVVLLASTHLTVILTRTADPATALAAAAESMPALPSGEAELTRREDGVVDRRALGWELREAGWSNKRIARELGVHPSTVGRWFAVAHLTDTTDTADEREETTP